jgi:hypothetical protein
MDARGRRDRPIASIAFIRLRIAAPAMLEPSVAKKTGTMRTSNADVPIAMLPRTVS